MDKALLVGGRSTPAFGGGEVLAPIEIYLAGRAVTSIGHKRVPVEELAIEHARQWLITHLRHLDVDRHVRLESKIRSGSVDLRSLWERHGATERRLANDTSCGAGFAPLSRLERLVLRVERTLNATEFRDRHPAGGEDVKVMGVRRRDAIELTVARAFVDRHLRGSDDYLAEKARVKRAVMELAGDAAVVVNAADDVETHSYYLTVTGTSAEAGDDGEVGRGNRVNGVITPCRPMSLEAAAGKNAVTHVGKLYNLACRSIAELLIAEVPEVLAARVHLVAKIGNPVSDPDLAHLELEVADPNALGSCTRSTTR